MRYTFTVFHVSTDEITVLELHSVRFPTNYSVSIELVWKLAVNYNVPFWHKAPRSVCCHVVSTCFVLILLLYKFFVMFCFVCDAGNSWSPAGFSALLHKYSACSFRLDQYMEVFVLQEGRL